jgi:hypothetical protein
VPGILNSNVGQSDVGEEKKKMALPDKSVFLMHLSVECLVEMQRSVMHRSQLLSFFLFWPFLSVE